MWTCSLPRRKEGSGILSEYDGLATARGECIIHVVGKPAKLQPDIGFPLLPRLGESRPLRSLRH